MIYRAAQLEEIVNDLMDMVEEEREHGQRLVAEATLTRLENSHLRKTLCAILAATQSFDVGEMPETVKTDIGEMIEDALVSARVFQTEDRA